MVRAALDLAFGDLGLHRVTAGCFADNVASWRVMEKAGMRREQHGIRDAWHAELGWVDGYTYAVLADERARPGRDHGVRVRRQAVPAPGAARGRLWRAPGIRPWARRHGEGNDQ